MNTFKMIWTLAAILWMVSGLARSFLGQPFTNYGLAFVLSLLCLVLADLTDLLDKVKKDEKT